VTDRVDYLKSHEPFGKKPKRPATSAFWRFTASNSNQLGLTIAIKLVIHAAICTGEVEVNGTEFETSVEYPDGLPGDESMNDAAKKVIVTVAVLSGAVLCQLGDSPILLEAGENQAFAGEIDNHQTRGVVVTTTYFSVKLRSEEDGLVTFYVPEKDKLAKHEVGQLLTGDQVTILWGREDGCKWVRDVAGEGSPRR
jgi:hypothetical protein